MGYNEQGLFDLTEPHEELKLKAGLWQKHEAHKKHMTEEAQELVNYIVEYKVPAEEAVRIIAGHFLLKYRDGQIDAIEDASEAVKRHCTAPEEAGDVEEIVSFVAKWIMDPPKDVPVMYPRKKDYLRW